MSDVAKISYHKTTMILRFANKLTPKEDKKTPKKLKSSETLNLTIEISIILKR